jgi:SH3-like domain-containing protein
MRSTVNRLAAALLCLLAAVQALAGCAEMSHEQTGAATGAGIGAVVGAVAGGLTDKKNPGQGALIGATAGALVGGAAGWAVGAYRVKQLKPREEAAAANNYTPQQGVVTKIDRTAATPQQLKPGDQLTVLSQYTVLGPPQNNQIRVREARTVFFNDQPLTELPARELVLVQGTNEIQSSITLPPDAADGNYRVMTTVEPLAVPNAQKNQASTAFVVSAAARPAASPASIRPDASRASATPSVVYVRNQTANLREGAGVGYRVLGTAPRGSQLPVVGEAGPEQNKWYKVKLADGREAWVASSAVGPNP